MARLGLRLRQLHEAGGSAAVLQHPLLRGNVGALAAASFAVMLLGLDQLTWPERWRHAALLLGSISYAVYLWHNAAPTMFRLAGAPVGYPLIAASVLATLVFAYVLHRLVERPMRDYGRTLSGAGSQAGAARAEVLT